MILLNSEVDMYLKKQYRCPVELTIDILGGKWKVLILWQLSIETLRFCQLKKLFPKITQKILTQQLRYLEERGLIIRTTYPEIPPKVEYSLSELGKTVKPILDKMNEWGQQYMDSNIKYRETKVSG